MTELPQYIAIDTNYGYVVGVLHPSEYETHYIQFGEFADIDKAIHMAKVLNEQSGNE